MIELVIVSRLLEYPDAALWQHQQEMFEAIAASKNLPKEDAHALGIFLRDLTTMDPLDAQAQYSELFDRGRATSLLLFEHVHGESRDRGLVLAFILGTINASSSAASAWARGRISPRVIRAASISTLRVSVIASPVKWLITSTCCLSGAKQTACAPLREIANNVNTAS